MNNAVGVGGMDFIDAHISEVKVGIDA